METSWRKGRISYERPRIMGILNVTPDSFSDGGDHYRSASEHAFRMIDEGADMIDIGGESTRPGFTPVSAEEEIRRIMPVLLELAGSADVPVSVDTWKPEVAEAAIDAGADIINDVYGLRADGMMELVASSGVAAVIMHMHGDPATLHSETMEGDAVAQVVGFLKERKAAALDAGMREDRMIMDPGVGFGKSQMQNVSIIGSAGEFSLGCPVLIGASRKRFLKTQLPGMSADEATAEMSLRAVRAGANILRVHNVAAVRDALEKHL
ncbi:MAG: dihydropteroate synthase [Thermoplasmatales archaeon]|jgi:dihydropteroate synthase|nr:dihydropteroate synthase [Thermoplasmatales archaeon]